MKLNKNFIVREVAGQPVALAVGERGQSFNGMIKMNSVGQFVFELLKNDTDIDSIVSEIMNKYDGVTEEAARESAEKVVAALRQNGLIND